MNDSLEGFTISISHPDVPGVAGVGDSVGAALEDWKRKVADELWQRIARRVKRMADEAERAARLVPASADDDGPQEDAP